VCEEEEKKREWRRPAEMYQLGSMKEHMYIVRRRVPLRQKERAVGARRGPFEPEEERVSFARK
jgi:hypothetical protein